MIPLDDGCNFDIVVTDKHGNVQMYRTSELLFDEGAQTLNSRGTRVWKARVLEEGLPCGRPVAVRDAWTERSVPGGAETLLAFLATEIPRPGRKRRYRTVYPDICRRVEHEGRLSRILSALADTVGGLYSCVTFLSSVSLTRICSSTKIALDGPRSSQHARQTYPDL